MAFTGRQTDVVRKFGPAIFRISERKRVAAQAIRESGLPLETGLWIVGTTFSWRIGTNLVPPLNGVKSWFDFRPGPLVQWLVSLAEIMVPPWTVIRSRSSGGQASVLLVNRSRRLVVFDLKRRTVLRPADPASAAAQIDAVDQLRAIHDCPRIDYDADRKLLVETFVAGEAFSAVSDGRQLECAKVMLAQVARAPRRHLDDDIRHAWAKSFDHLCTKIGHSRPMVQAHVAEFMRSTATCSMHGDLNGENIVINAAGYQLIDLDSISVGPAFFDTVHLSLTEAWWGRSYLLRTLMMGSFDEELRKLGIDLYGDTPQDRRVALCCAAIAWKFGFGKLPESRAIELIHEVLAAARSVGSVQSGSMAPSSSGG